MPRRRKLIQLEEVLVHPLSYIRAQHGWTYQDLVDAIANQVGNMARRREKAWKWEHWGIVPDRETQLALAKILDIPQENVELFHWPEWLPDEDPVRIDFPWNQAGSMIAVEHALGYALMDRRGFMGLTGLTLVGFAETWMNIDRAELDAVLGGGRIGDDFVDQMEAGLPRLRMLEAAYGGQRARKLIDAELGMVIEVLSKSSYTAAVARRLHALAAELGRVAGFASFDAGLHSAAQRYWVGAIHAAHTAGDRVLAANILKSMSLQCHDFGRFSEALHLARCAREGAGQPTSRTIAMLMMREARAYAAMGNATTCERLISAADTHLEHGPAEDDPACIAYFDEAEFHAQAGSCYVDLGRPRKADEHLAGALERFPRAKVRDHATYLTRRARAQSDLRNLDEATALLSAVIPLIQQAPSQRNIERLFAVRDLLPRDARRRDLDEQLAALAR